MELAVFIVVIFIFVHPLLGIRRKDMAASVGDLVLAGGRVKVGGATSSLLATMLGASAVIGTAGLGWKHGWAALLWLGSGVLGLISLRFLAGRVRFEGRLSLPDLLGGAGGLWIKRMSAMLIVPAWVGVTAAQLSAAGRICEGTGIGPYVVYVSLCSAMVAIYVIISGQRGVIRTDVVQLGVIAAFLLTLFLGGVWGSGGTGEPAGFEVLPLGSAVDIVFAVAFPYLVGPDIYSRLLTVSSARDRGRVLLLAAFGLAIAAVAIVGLGVMARGVLPELPGGPDSLLVVLSGTVFGDWGRIVAAVGLLAVVLSSADTCLMSAGTILSVDLLGRRSVAGIRISVALVAVLAGVVAIWLKGVIPVLMWSYTVYTSGLAIPVIWVLFLRRRLSSLEIVVTMLAGATMGVVGQASKWPFTLPMALGVAFLALAMTRLLGRVLNRKTTPVDSKIG